MAANRIRSAFAAPRKGETFELRAGLVYAMIVISHVDRQADTFVGRNMRMKGSLLADLHHNAESNLTRDAGKRPYKRPSWR